MSNESSDNDEAIRTHSIRRERDLSVPLSEKNSASIETHSIRRNVTSSSPPPIVTCSPANPPHVPTVSVPRRRLETECPNCRIKLVDPEGLGLCTNCGYCRSIDLNDDKLTGVHEIPPDETALTGLKAIGAAILAVPGWFLVLLAGSAAVILVAYSCSEALPQSSLERTKFSTFALVSGLAIIMLSQWWLFLMIGDEVENLRVLDLTVVSGKLWSLAIQKLPDTRWPVYLGCWGLTGMLCAAFLIGELDGWLATAAPTSKRV